MLSGRNNRIEEAFEAYYGMSRQAYLDLIYKENCGIIVDIDNKVFEGLTKSSTQYTILDNRALTSSIVSRKGNDTVC